jgi:hypothetical protein
MFSLLSVFLFIQSNQVLVWFSCQFVCVFSCGKPSIVDRQDSSFPLKLAYFIIFLCWHFLFHLCSFPDFVRFLHHPCQFLGFLAHRIHGAAIYDNIYHQYTPVMLAHVPYMDPMGYGEEWHLGSMMVHKQKTVPCWTLRSLADRCSLTNTPKPYWFDVSTSPMHWDVLYIQFFKFYQSCDVIM